MLLQVMKTYHMYHTESISAESKLKEAEKQEEKHIGKANDIGSSLLRYGHDERPQRRSSVKKMEKMKEKVCFAMQCICNERLEYHQLLFAQMALENAVNATRRPYLHCAK